MIPTLVEERIAAQVRTVRRKGVGQEKAKAQRQRMQADKRRHAYATTVQSKLTAEEREATYYLLDLNSPDDRYPNKSLLFLRYRDADGRIDWHLCKLAVQHLLTQEGLERVRLKEQVVAIKKLRGIYLHTFDEPFPQQMEYLERRLQMTLVQRGSIVRPELLQYNRATFRRMLKTVRNRRIRRTLQQQRKEQIRWVANQARAQEQTKD